MDKITIVLIDKILYHTNMNTTYKSNNNVVYSCKYHVVWCPKYRRKVLTNGVDVRLKELLTEYAANLSVDILEMEIMPDHVHMLLEVDPQFGIHKAVKLLKKISDQNRQEKLKNQLHAVALRHIICCFLHDDNLVTFPFFIPSCKSYKISIS